MLLGGLEPSLLPPEGSALSTELQEPLSPSFTAGQGQRTQFFCDWDKGDKLDIRYHFTGIERCRQDNKRPGPAIPDCPYRMSPDKFGLSALWFRTFLVSTKSGEVHFGPGMWMRNNWGLWSDQSRLKQYFDSGGVYAADSISSLIVTSYWRYLNGCPIELPRQIMYNIIARDGMRSAM